MNGFLVPLGNGNCRYLTTSDDVMNDKCELIINKIKSSSSYT